MIIVVVGPTGTGKTKLSVALAKKYNAEIINADSMQIYKGLDIGTAKVTEGEKENIPHHLFDICKVNDFYTVFEYQKDARKKIDELEKKGKNVVFVGGTGLYVKAALFNYQFQEGTTYNQYNDLSNEELVEEIKKYKVVNLPHLHNRKRLVRLLNKLSNEEEETNQGNELLYSNVVFLYLKADREELYKRLDERVEQMFSDGLLQEVLKVQQDFATSKALKTGIGYKEFIPYFEGNCSLEEVKEQIKKNTRHYAKRQETFFKHQLPCREVKVDFNDFSKTILEAEKIVDEKI